MKNILNKNGSEIYDLKLSMIISMDKDINQSFYLLGLLLCDSEVY